MENNFYDQNQGSNKYTLNDLNQASGESNTVWGSVAKNVINNTGSNKAEMNEKLAQMKALRQQQA